MAGNNDSQSQLVNKTRNGKTVEIRTETMLRGFLAQAKAAHTSTNPKGFDQWLEQVTTAIPEYQSAIAGQQSGGATGG